MTKQAIKIVAAVLGLLMPGIASACTSYCPAPDGVTVTVGKVRNVAGRDDWWEAPIEVINSTDRSFKSVNLTCSWYDAEGQLINAQSAAAWQVPPYSKVSVTGSDGFGLGINSARCRVIDVDY